MSAAVALKGRDTNPFNGEVFTFQVPRQDFPVGTTTVRLFNKVPLRLVGVTVMHEFGPGHHRISLRIGGVDIIPANSSADPSVAGVGLTLVPWGAQQWIAPVGGVVVEREESADVTIQPAPGAATLTIILFCTAVDDVLDAPNLGPPPEEPLQVRVIQ